MLGKRKRETTVLHRHNKTETINHPNGSENKASDDGNNDNSYDVFRQYFEKSYGPLQGGTTKESEIPYSEDESEDNDSEEEDEDNGFTARKYSANNINGAEDFAGFSDDEEAIRTPNLPVVEIIEATSYTPDEGQEIGDDIDRIFKKKKFMTSRPPRNDDTDDTVKGEKPSSNPTDKDEDDDDASNLKNDLDLQRLLRESHLLSQSRGHAGLSSSSTASGVFVTSSTTTTLHGKQRHQATELRLAELGSRTSTFAQASMPMSHRKGIQLKNKTMEARRQREARENGVILERSKKGSSGHGGGGGQRKTGVKRDRGVDVPVLGKFRGGTLSLSKKDVASIQGPSKRGGGGKKTGRR